VPQRLIRTNSLRDQRTKGQVLNRRADRAVASSLIIEDWLSAVSYWPDGSALALCALLVWPVNFPPGGTLKNAWPLRQMLAPWGRQRCFWKNLGPLGRKRGKVANELRVLGGEKRVRFEQNSRNYDRVISSSRCV
jgi:hypothetical protein